MSALQEAVRAIERECAAAEWTKGVVLYALVPTVDVIESAPEIAAALAERPLTSLTAIEQEAIQLSGTIEEFLGTISWSPEVFGAALTLERMIINEEPPERLSEVALAQWVAAHGHEVRMVVGVLRDGSQECAMRLRIYDDESAVMAGPDLLPGMAEALSLTFTD